MNVQIIKNGPTLALILTPSVALGLNLTDGQWCAATLIPGANPANWDGPAAIPAVGGSSTAGSGTLSQPAGGSYTLGYVIVPGVGTNSQPNSKLFMFTGGQLLESQEFDLVDVAAVPTPSPATPLTLTATPQLISGIPSIQLSWAGG